MKDNLLITGHTKGLGKFVVEKLNNDFHIFGVARHSLDMENVINYQFDLQDFSYYDSFFKKLSENDTIFSAVILNAGVGYFGKFNDIEADKYQEIIEVNLLSPILFLQKLLPYLKKDAKIIFIGSVIGKKFLPNGAVYGASKFGLRGFAGILKKEYKKQVHIINPSILETTFHNNCNSEIPNGKVTDMQLVLDTIQDILSGKEQRFEIDL